MAKDITYCEKTDCDIMTCVRNRKHINEDYSPYAVAHLEGNPMYCKKNDWNGNQYKEAVKEV